MNEQAISELLITTTCFSLSAGIFFTNGLMLQADGQQLKQVLLNLMLNGLEAMATGGRLEVSTLASGSRLTIRVTDTGCGVSQEDLRHVFDPFFTTKERGMGLGLAIVKGIVERHGGKIAIASQQGRGTSVDICLPYLQARPGSNLCF